MAEWLRCCSPVPTTRIQILVPPSKIYFFFLSFLFLSFCFFPNWTLWKWCTVNFRICRAVFIKTSAYHNIARNCVTHRLTVQGSNDMLAFICKLCTLSDSSIYIFEACNFSFCFSFWFVILFHFFTTIYYGSGKVWILFPWETRDLTRKNIRLVFW